jgi:hypothetical protein
MASARKQVLAVRKDVHETVVGFPRHVRPFAVQGSVRGITPMPKFGVPREVIRRCGALG